MTNLINYTNNKLNNFYKNANLDYGVNGNANTLVEGNKITIHFNENGVSKSWSMAFYPDYVAENGLDYFFNVWMEEAN
jgi:hypothetical protein